MTDETAHIATAAALLDNPCAALSQHLHGDGDLPRPQSGEQWRHHSGRVYTVLFLTNNEGDGVKDKYPVTVVYQGDNGKRWSGPLSDWHRRMTRIEGDNA